MPGTSAYNPLEPARRPGGRPEAQPRYRVLVHHRFANHYAELVDRVGLQQAQQLWDHLSQVPGGQSGIAATCILRGKAGKPLGPGWSRTVHYELTGSARADYQFHDAYQVDGEGDPHPVVAILTLNFGSH